MSTFMSLLKHLFFVSKNFEFFWITYKDGKPKP